MKTLYLIDGHAQIFRAFFAVRTPMSSPVTGEPTNATFAFTGMLLKLLEQNRPDYIAMAIDRGGSDVRSALYPAYKQNRDPMPDDLKAQEERIFEVTRQFGIPVIGLEGHEADDIIATLVTRLTAAHDDLHIRIVSKDKDLEQLISDRVALFDIHTDTLIDEAALLENKGITPAQVIDVLSLIGDSVDNIPGIAGVGPKTAVKLIGEYGTLENLFDNLDRIKGKRRENLEAGAPFVQTAKELVTLHHDVPVELDLQQAEARPDADALDQTFENLGFRGHRGQLKKILGGATASADGGAPKNADKKKSAEPAPFGLFAGDAPEEAAPVVEAEGDYRLIRTSEELDAAIDEARKAPLLAFDTETCGRGWHAGLAGVSLSWAPGSAVYIPVRSPAPDTHLDEAAVIARLRPLMEDADVPKTAHNAKFDVQVFAEAGVTVRGIAGDTMIAGYLLQLPGLSLDAMALSLLGRSNIRFADVAGSGKAAKSLDQIDVEAVTQYAAEDADVALQLTQLLQPRVDAAEMTALLRDVELPLAGVLAAMERTGIRVDPDVLDEQRDRLGARVDELRADIRAAAGLTGQAADGFNIDSTKQLREHLFDRLKFPVVKRTKTGPSTDVESLNKLAEHDALAPGADSDVPEAARAIPALLIEYRQLTKLVGTYLTSLKDAIRHETRRIHCSFNQTVTATGRLSSNDPNLQNIPIRTDLGRAIRKAFLPAEGHVLIAADYSQIELRVLAHLAEDEALIDAFSNDLDIHQAVAAQVFDTPLADVTPEQRASAKTINFGIVYGITSWGLSKRIPSLSPAEAEQLISDYKARFTGIDRFLSACVQDAISKGYVQTMLGRRRAIEEVTSRNPNQRQLGERYAINTVVQGSAADLIKLAMINLHRDIAAGGHPERMLLQIHDELVLEAPEADADAATERLRTAMESAMELRVPLKVDTGRGTDWYACK